MGPWWLTWHLCLYICEKCEMSRLWHTDTHTHGQWKVVQYSVWAESAMHVHDTTWSGQWVEVVGVAVPEEEVRQVEAPGGEAPFLLSAWVVPVRFSTKQHLLLANMSALCHSTSSFWFHVFMLEGVFSLISHLDQIWPHLPTFYYFRHILAILIA